jgi:hypothetical protein
LKTNISTPDRYLRLLTGLVAYGSSNNLKRGSLGKGLLMTLGAMKIAEGITGWCPLTYIFEQTGKEAPRGADARVTSREREERIAERDSSPVTVRHSATGKDRERRGEPASGGDENEHRAEPLPDHTHTDEDV